MTSAIKSRIKIGKPSGMNTYTFCNFSSRVLRFYKFLNLLTTPMTQAKGISNRDVITKTEKENNI